MGGATRFFVLLSGPLPLIHHRRPSLLRLASRYPKFCRSSLSSSPYLQPYKAHPSLIPSSSFQPIKASRPLHSQVSTIGDDFGNLQAPNSCNWPEWSKLLQSLMDAGFFDRQDLGGIAPESEFVAAGELPVDFVRAATACLVFALERPHLLGLLSRRDIEVLVENGSPYLFRDANASMRKMKLFLRGSETHVLESDKAHTIDLFKFILSHVRNPTTSSDSSLCTGDMVESSTRNLLSEICKLCSSDPDVKLPETVNQFPDKYGQSQGAYRQKVEMKRGDWICPRCSFMNFARNVKCLECEEARPKRQLTGGEWECPQCDFFNYGRNTVCLRCDCKRPGSLSLGNININSGMGYDNGNNAAKADMDSRLAANEEKAQRWFSKISQLDGTSDSSTSMNDEDFPEIMPLRKGVNRFVVSTRKTPLERRVSNAQYRRNLGNDGAPENNSCQLGTANKPLDNMVSQSLDDILGRISVDSQSTNVENGQGNRTNNVSSSGSGSLQYESSKQINSGYVPFVPLPPDMFAKKSGNSSEENDRVVTDTDKSAALDSHGGMGRVSQSNGSYEVGEIARMVEKPLDETRKIDEGKEEAENPDRWFKRVAELHNVTDHASGISDEDFPEVMPMRKGENRFVVSRKKDRSLTSPAYKRRVAMEQANNSNFVPFVPFPPDYFVKKDQPSLDDSTGKSTDNASISDITNNSTEQLDNDRIGLSETDNSQLQIRTRMLNSELPAKNLDQNNLVPNIQSSTENFAASRSDGKHGSSNVGKEANKNISLGGSSSSAPEIQNIREKWSGKSLEGSAVTEPDPLDMSEEAKAQRWFRRVAQIKDISELSQIPDEDFPSIMPMRKGVNRFVVSKRKTPLERRLTSPQYRRNLPIISSDPPKKENDGS